MLVLFVGLFTLVEAHRAVDQRLAIDGIFKALRHFIIIAGIEFYIYQEKYKLPKVFGERLDLEISEQYQDKTVNNISFAFRSG
mgnify:CR=1 FL=1